MKPILLRCLVLFFLYLPFAGCGAQPEVASANRDTLSFLDINVWAGLTYKGTFWISEYETPKTREKRYQALLQQIKALSPDVIAIHEANPLPEYASRLARDLKYDVYSHVGVSGVHLGPLTAPVNLREGDAILAKRDLQMTVVGRKQLTGSPIKNQTSFNFDDATQVLGVTIVNKSKPLFIFATHWRASPPNSDALRKKAEELQKQLQLSKEEVEKVLLNIKERADSRLEEAKQTYSFMKEKAGDAHYVLMGDFNTDPGSPAVQYMISQGMLDTFAQLSKPLYTWDPVNNLNQKFYKDEYNEKEAMEKKDLLAILEHLFDSQPQRRIDFILTGPTSKFGAGKCRIQQSKVVLNQVSNGVHPSDHFGVFTQLTCPGSD